MTKIWPEICSCGEEIGTGDRLAHLHHTPDSAAELFEVVRARAEAEGCDCNLEVRFLEGFQHTMVVHDGRCSMPRGVT